MKSVTKVRVILIAAALASAGAASAQEAALNAAALPAAADEAELLSLEDMGALSGGTGVEVVIDVRAVAVTRVLRAVEPALGAGPLRVGFRHLDGNESAGSQAPRRGEKESADGAAVDAMRHMLGS